MAGIMQEWTLHEWAMAEDIAGVDKDRVTFCELATLLINSELSVAEMEPGHESPRHWVTGSAILTGSGQVTGQCVISVFDQQVLYFNMRIYRGVVSTE